MKKTISILIVLCVAASLFAANGITVKAGGSFGFTKMSVNVQEGGIDYKDSVKANGFGFDAGVQYNINDAMFVFGEFTMLFPAEETYTRGLVEYVHVADSNNKLSYLSITAGVGYKLPLDVPVKVSVGGGLFANREVRKYTYELVKHTDSFSSMGIAGMVEIKYLFTEEFGVALTVLPQFGILSRETERKESDSAVKRSWGLSIGFSMPIVLGVSYSF